MLSPRAQGHQVIECQARITRLDRPTIGGQDTGTECAAVVELCNTAIEGGATADQRALQGPGATVDGQVVEVDVIGTRCRTGARSATAHTEGVLQDQGAAAGGATVYLAGRGKRQLNAEQAAQTEPEATGGGNGRPGNGGKGVGAAGAHRHAAGNAPGVDEGVARGRGFECNAPGQGTVVDHVDRSAALHRDHRGIGAEQAKAEQ